MESLFAKNEPLNHPFTPSHFIERIDNIRKAQNHLHIIYHHHLEHNFLHIQVICIKKLVKVVVILMHTQVVVTNV
jgi:hypothetical protein